MAFDPDTPLIVEHVSARHWKLTQRLVYHGAFERFEVYEGYDTNFASVPRPFTWLVPTSGRYTRATVLHDYLCDKCEKGEFQWNSADGIFRRAMGELGVPTIQRYVIWGAVRAWHLMKDGRLADAVGLILLAVTVFLLAGLPVWGVSTGVNLLPGWVAVLSGPLWVSLMVALVLVTMTVAEYFLYWAHLVKMKLLGGQPFKSPPGNWW